MPSDHQSTTLSELERRVLELDVAAPLALTARDLDALLADPAYHASLGKPPHATHYRRSLGDGRGLHLVIDAGGTAALHWDRYDPHGSPAGMLMHLLTDAPRETIALFAAGSAVLRRLGE
jgi:hypothetical protein